jgi:DNA-binding CsgD family transcriptional regulator
MKERKPNYENTLNELEKIVSLTDKCNNIPFHVYAKNSKGIYLYGNNIFARSFGLNSSEEMKGKTDFDLLTRSDAQIIRKNDLYVMDINKIDFIEEKVTINNHINTYYSQKFPLSCLDVSIRTKGIICGISFNITKNENLTSIFDLLSKRENQIINMVIARKVAKQIAAELKLNIKTVYSYLSRIREKLGVDTTIQLMEKINNLDPKS